MTDGNLTYAGSGVSYGVLDPFKRLAQRAGRNTGGNIARLGFTEVAASRGESAFLIESEELILAHVDEGLGTKNLVIEHPELPINPRLWTHIAQDAVAMIVNDIVTLGALTLSVTMHLSIGSSGWLEDPRREEYLIEGWEQACNLARCTWGGGETPELQDIVKPETAVLSGSAVGIIKPKDRLIKGNIQDGDAIVMLAGSGIHANGLTLARRIAQHTGYLAKIPGGRLFAEALLDPTPIYAPVIEDILDAGIRPHYAVNITGHGWRKLMRAVEPFAYIIERVPEPQPIFRFIEKNGPVDEKEMYANYNMGAGFAVYVDPRDVDQVIAIAQRLGISAFRAGRIEKSGGEKAVVIEPKGITFSESTLEVR